MSAEPQDFDPGVARTARVHLRIGWGALWGFASLGLLLEGLHACKSAAYLGMGNETRRLMWTLAHAHGVGLSLLNMGFAVTIKLGCNAVTRRLRLASSLLSWATVLLPGGFFLGGVVTYDGDPGIGVLFAPIGALLLWVCIGLVVLELRREDA